MLRARIEWVAWQRDRLEGRGLLDGVLNNEPAAIKEVARTLGKYWNFFNRSDVKGALTL